MRVRTGNEQAWHNMGPREASEIDDPLGALVNVEPLDADDENWLEREILAGIGRGRRVPEPKVEVEE